MLLFLYLFLLIPSFAASAQISIDIEQIGYTKPQDLQGKYVALEVLAYSSKKTKAGSSDKSWYRNLSRPLVKKNSQVALAVKPSVVISDKTQELTTYSLYHKLAAGQNITEDLLHEMYITPYVIMLGPVFFNLDFSAINSNDIESNLLSAVVGVINVANKVKPTKLLSPFIDLDFSKEAKAMDETINKLFSAENSQKQGISLDPLKTEQVIVSLMIADKKIPISIIKAKWRDSMLTSSGRLDAYPKGSIKGVRSPLTDKTIAEIVQSSGIERKLFAEKAEDMQDFCREAKNLFYKESLNDQDVAAAMAPFLAESSYNKSLAARPSPDAPDTCSFVREQLEMTNLSGLIKSSRELESQGEKGRQEKIAKFQQGDWQIIPRAIQAKSPYNWQQILAPVFDILVADGEVKLNDTTILYSDEPFSDMTKKEAADLLSVSRFHYAKLTDANCFSMNSSGPATEYKLEPRCFSIIDDKGNEQRALLHFYLNREDKIRKIVITMKLRK